MQTNALIHQENDESGIGKAKKLFSMDEKEFFAESVMFMLGKTIGLMKGTVTAEEYKRSKAVIDGVIQARKLKQWASKPLPKYPEKGWLFPYLYEGSCRFDGRWRWWTDCLLNEKVEGSIPQIVFNGASCDAGVKETISHIEKILRKLETMQGSSSLMTWVQWLLWGFGSKNVEERRWPEEVDSYLYREFELGRMQQHPFDYMAKFSQESRGNSRWSNPTAFYQTPQNVAECMARMLFNGENDITKSVIDCCAGTGTLLLAASNFSVNIHAAEISLDLCLMLEINAYLFIPWLVKPAPWLGSMEQLPKQVTNPEKSIEGHPPQKRVYVGNREIEFKEQNGQLLLFDITE